MAAWRPFKMEKFRVLGYYILRDLVHDYWRSLLTIMNIAVVVVSYLLLSSLSQAFVLFGKQSQIASNLVIISADILDPMESTLNENVLKMAVQIAPDQIRNAFPTLFRHMSIQGQVMQVRAAPLVEMSTALALTLIDGRWPDGPQQIVISEGVTQITSWKINSFVQIYGTDFQVVGVVRAGGNKFASIWMTYDEGQRLFGVSHGFQMGVLQLDPSANPESVRARLEADPRFSGQYAIYQENTLSDRYNQINHDLIILSVIQALICLLTITFGTYNAVSLSLTERSHEILLLRVVGFTKDKLRGLLLTRTLILAAAAYILGWITAFVFIQYQRTNAPISIQAAPLVLNLSVFATLLGFFLIVAFAFLGVWLTVGHLTTLTLTARGE
jgi:ABC-type antimicrobial peptide transport system permease subunit